MVKFVVVVGEVGTGKSKLADAIQLVDTNYAVIDTSRDIIAPRLARRIRKLKRAGKFRSLCEELGVNADLVPDQGVMRALIKDKQALRPLYDNCQGIIRSPSLYAVMNLAIAKASVYESQGMKPIIVGARWPDLCRLLRNFDDVQWHVIHVTASDEMREKRLTPDGWAKACLKDSMEENLNQEIETFKESMPDKVWEFRNDEEFPEDLVRRARVEVIPFLDQVLWNV